MVILRGKASQRIYAWGLVGLGFVQVIWSLVSRSMMLSVGALIISISGLMILRAAVIIDSVSVLVRNPIRLTRIEIAQIAAVERVFMNGPRLAGPRHSRSVVVGVDIVEVGGRRTHVFASRRADYGFGEGFFGPSHDLVFFEKLADCLKGFQRVAFVDRVAAEQPPPERAT